MSSGLLRNAVEVPDGVFVQPLVHTDQLVCALGFRFIYADLIAASLAPLTVSRSESLLLN